MRVFYQYRKFFAPFVPLCGYFVFFVSFVFFVVCMPSTLVSRPSTTVLASISVY
jgi:hypothetical protein